MYEFTNIMTSAANRNPWPACMMCSELTAPAYSTLYLLGLRLEHCLMTASS